MLAYLGSISRVLRYKISIRVALVQTLNISFYQTERRSDHKTFWPSIPQFQSYLNEERLSSFIFTSFNGLRCMLVLILFLVMVSFLYLDKFFHSGIRMKWQKKSTAGNASKYMFHKGLNDIAWNGEQDPAGSQQKGTGSRVKLPRERESVGCGVSSPFPPAFFSPHPRLESLFTGYCLVFLFVVTEALGELFLSPRIPFVLGNISADVERCVVVCSWEHVECALSSSNK